MGIWTAALLGIQPRRGEATYHMRPRRLELLLTAWAIFSVSSSTARAQIEPQVPQQQAIVSDEKTEQGSAFRALPIDETFEDTIDVLPELGLPVGGLDRLSNVIVLPKPDGTDGLLHRLLEPEGVVSGKLTNRSAGRLVESIDGAGAKMPGAVDDITENSTRTVDRVINAIVPEHPRP